jgi:hypothetical protein
MLCSTSWRHDQLGSSAIPLRVFKARPDLIKGGFRLKGRCALQEIPASSVAGDRCRTHGRMRASDRRDHCRRPPVGLAPPGNAGCGRDRFGGVEVVPPAAGVGDPAPASISTVSARTIQRFGQGA